MAYDEAHQEVVMFGAAAYGPGVTRPPANDTWTFDAAGWHQRDPKTSPPALGGALLTDDPASRDLLLLGIPATADPSTAATQTWTWDGMDWTRRADLPAREQVVGLATLTSQRDVVLVTEPLLAGGPPANAHTWAWNGSAWSLRHPAVDLPLGSARPLLVSDPAHRRVLALLAATQDEQPQTWAWDGTSWSRLAAPNQPPYDPITSSAAEDPGTGDVVLYMGGGEAAEGGKTWLFDGVRWEPTATGPSPAIDTDYDGAQLLADTRAGAVIVIGDAGRPNSLDVLWVFTDNRWTATTASGAG